MGLVVVTVSTSLASKRNRRTRATILLLELRIVQLAGDDAAHGHFARGRDGEFQHHLALQLRLLAQRTAVQRVDRALVAVEDQLDLLAAARGLAAVAGARRSAGISPTRAMFEVTAVVSCPVSEPAPGAEAAARSSRW